MKSALVLIAVAVLVLGSMLTFLVVLRPDSEVDGCAPGTVGVLSADEGSGSSSLDAAQRANATRVIAEGRRRALPEQAIVIALAVASQESGFRNYANDGKGGDLDYLQQSVARSLSLPHEAVGSDHGSLGVFQQQWPWWGTMRQLMDPTAASDKFYDALLRVPGWASMPLTVAAQRVQRSAYPDAYADDEPLARGLVGGSAGGVVQAAALNGTGAGCAAGVSGGVVHFPLPSGSGYTDLGNWGHRASRWAHGHTGTDLSVACGTPVLAATAGTVIVRTDQSWAGRWLVEVSTGAGELTTWYAHMRALLVADGQQVTAGEQIGEVGDLGNATGCHLHFEVHPHGGTIYQDNTNPTVWLASHAGHSLGPAGGGFAVATFNTLGASHTAAGGNKAWMASGAHRTHGVVQVLSERHVDVAGLQEFQTSQYRTFKHLTGSAYGAWHPRGDTENTIVWRRDRWSFSAARSFPIPYFDGHRRRMPIVRLKERGTGRVITFVNVHNPADTRRYPRQGRWRAASLAAELRVVRAERRAGGGVVVTGDFNDHRTSLCWLARRAHLASADGGGAQHRCQPVRGSGIDWILASAGLPFGQYVVDHSALVRAITDHPLVLTTVR